MASKKIRRYKEWPGRNKFLCNGHIMLGSNPIWFLFTIFLTTWPFVIYIVFIQFEYKLKLFHLVIMGILFVFGLHALFNAALREPGIIPRNPPKHILEPEIPKNAIHSSWKYCETCNIYRPPRCKHCKYCDNCVQHFDHHCPWVGNCIGIRNYCYFLEFVFSITILCGYMCSLTMYVSIMEVLKLKGKDEWSNIMWKLLSQNPALIVIDFFTFLVFCSLFGLAGYHLNLIRKGETTNEQVRGTFKGIKNPYHKGFCRNFTKIFCEPSPKSQLSVRAYIIIPDEEIPYYPLHHPLITVSSPKMNVERKFCCMVPVSKKKNIITVQTMEDAIGIEANQTP